MIPRRSFINSAPLVGAALTLGLSALPAWAQRSGSFEGLSTHVTEGTARIVEEDGTYYVEFGEDFMHDQSPDPRVGLGKDGYDPSTKLGELKSRNGQQRYEIPASIDVSQYNEIWLWCDVADVPLGRASLN